MKDKNEIIYSFEPLWGLWKVDEFIGAGNFGKVYRVAREEWGQKYVSAVKLISIPQSNNEFKEAQSIGIDDMSMHGYFQDFVKNIVNEIEVMYKLKGNSNIVSYEDHLIKEKEGEVGWHILIKMEYLQSLTEYASEHQLGKREVIKLGIDICKALETCEKEKIIHRDIKDANIFVSKNGDFKLGDFGIAKELSKSGRAASMRGTPLYMAPEVYKGDNYDSTVDTYSLGIVMYKLLNKGRLPFMPPYPQPITYRHTESSIESRIKGERPDIPIDAGKDLGEIILKACSYLPKERFKVPNAMRTELEKILFSIEDDYIEVVSEETIAKVPNLDIEATDIIVNNQEQHNNKQDLDEENLDKNIDNGSSNFDGTVSIFDVINPETKIEDNKVEDNDKNNKKYSGTVSIFDSENKEKNNLNKTVSIFKDNGKSKVEENKINQQEDVKIAKVDKEKDIINKEQNVKQPKALVNKKQYIMYGAIAVVVIVGIILFSTNMGKDNKDTTALGTDINSEAQITGVLSEQSYIENAKLLYNEDKFEEALAELEKELTQNPNNETAKTLDQQYRNDYSTKLTEVGVAKIAENKLEEAKTSFETAISINAQNTTAVDKLNEVNDILAKANVTEEVAKETTEKNNLVDEARQYFRNGSYKSAISSLKKAIQENSSNSSLVSKWGKELINSKSYKNAISYLTAAKNGGFKVNDLLGDAYYEYGISFYNKGDYSTAMDNLNKAKGYGKNVGTAITDAQYGHAKDLYNKGSYTSALDNFHTAKNLGANIELTYVRGYLTEINSQLESLKKDLVDFDNNYSTKEEINGKEGLKGLINTHSSRLDNLRSRRNSIFSLNESVASDSKGKACDALLNFCAATIKKLKDRINS